MPPDTPESQLAVLRSRVAALEVQVNALGPTATQVATLAVQLGYIDQDLKDLNRDVAGIKSTLDTREERQAQDRRAIRVALIGLIATLVATLLTVAGALIVAFA
jgi:hypothetical protein